MRHLKWTKAAASTAVFACLFAGTVFAADSEDLSSCVVDGNQIKITGTAVHTEDEGQGEAGQKTETADDGKYYLFDLMQIRQRAYPLRCPSTRTRTRIRCLPDMWWR